MEQATVRRVGFPHALLNADLRYDGTKAPLPRLGYYRKGWPLHVDHANRWRIARATDRGKD